MDQPKVISVVGPTAAGKTALSIALAKACNGEVISADSRQVYKKLDIGTAKVTQEEMDGVPHHLIDVVDIDTTYTVADFKADARVAIQRILGRGHVPIIAGGTFFYLDALLGKAAVSEVPPNPELRSQLEEKEVADLYTALLKLDPRRAAEVDPENKRRIIRSLEIISQIGAVPPPQPNTPPYNILTFGILIDKKLLRERFQERAETWLQNGFKEEVRDLFQEGVSRERLHEIGFEYTLMLELLDGLIDETQFIEKFVQKNWQYAKRQYTWLKRDKTIQWVDPKNTTNTITTARYFLKSNKQN